MSRFKEEWLLAKILAKYVGMLFISNTLDFLTRIVLKLVDFINRKK